MSSTEGLEQRLALLEKRVQNQSKVIAQTGQHIIQLGLASRKAAIDQLGARGQELQAAIQPPQQAGSVAAAGNPDSVTNDDLEELAMEMQVQLGLLEERSRCRIVNATATLPEHALEPLPNVEGEFAPNFPKTLQEFNTLKDEDVLSLCEFYELLDESAPAPDVAISKDTLAKFISIISR